MNHGQGRDSRLKRLAARIEALVDKDQRRQDHAREIADLRRRAAAELHAICADFVVSLNRLLANSEVTLDPPSFPADGLHEDAPNLIQINVRGRTLQIDFAVTSELMSTEDFRVPY